MTHCLVPYPFKLELAVKVNDHLNLCISVQQILNGLGLSNSGWFKVSLKQVMPIFDLIGKSPAEPSRQI
jgi:hypothetical protein